MKRIAALLLSLALLPTFSFADDRLVIPDKFLNGWKTDAKWIAAGRALDLGTTEWALARNPALLEGNPLMRSREVRIGANLLYVVGASLACKELRKRGHPEKAKWAARVVFALSLGLAVNAVVQERKGP